MAIITAITKINEIAAPMKVEILVVPIEQMALNGGSILVQSISAAKAEGASIR